MAARRSPYYFQHTTSGRVFVRAAASRIFRRYTERAGLQKAPLRNIAIFGETSLLAPQAAG
jgi:hypothetical protein